MKISGPAKRGSTICSRYIGPRWIKCDDHWRLKIRPAGQLPHALILEKRHFSTCFHLSEPILSNFYFFVERFENLIMFVYHIIYNVKIENL